MNQLRNRLRRAWRALTGREPQVMGYVVVPDEFDVAPHVYLSATEAAKAIARHRSYGRGLPVGAADLAELQAYDFVDAGDDRVWAVPFPPFDQTDTVRYNRIRVTAARTLPKKEANHGIPNRVMAVSRWGETSPVVDPGAVRDALAIAGYGIPAARQEAAPYRGTLHDELDFPWGDVPFAPDGPQDQTVRKASRVWEPGDEDIPF